MPDVQVETFDEAQVQDALILVAFPTTGSVSTITARYLRNELDLPLVGHLTSDAFPAICAIENGIATTPLRIFGGEVECGLEGECPRLYVVSSEMPVPPPLFQSVADAILEWGKSARMLVAIEGVVRSEGDDEPDVFCAAWGPSSLERLKQTGVPVLQQAIVGGVTSSLLLASRRTGIAAGAMVVEASRSHPDGHAAAALIAAVDNLVPQIQVDLGPLKEQAAKIEAQVGKQLKEAEANQPHPTTFV